MIIREHHKGMMVNDLDAEVKKYEALGYKLYKRFTKPGIKAAMLFKDESGVEFFEFENPDDETEQMIKQHTAFVSDDLENDIQEYIGNGYELAIPITGGTVTKRFAYLKDSAGGYIELLELLD
jgi:catechol 2,3-dioxygenase-like lactoylglutathione lyase family enzyme